MDNTASYEGADQGSIPCNRAKVIKYSCRLMVRIYTSQVYDAGSNPVRNAKYGDIV